MFVITDLNYDDKDTIIDNILDLAVNEFGSTNSAAESQQRPFIAFPATPIPILSKISGPFEVDK
jgi:hypothetical protein